MRISVGELRRRIRESIDCWGGSRPEETYDEELADDPMLKKRSVIVPDDVKEPILRWMKAMGLSGAKKKRSS
jgi:hypothetical protein